jgi:hypothetical protein
VLASWRTHPYRHPAATAVGGRRTAHFGDLAVSVPA